MNVRRTVILLFICCSCSQRPAKPEVQGRPAVAADTSIAVSMVASANGSDTVVVIRKAALFYGPDSTQMTSFTTGPAQENSSTA